VDVVVTGINSGMEVATSELLWRIFEVN
jgi:hypothetical protein